MSSIPGGRRVLITGLGFITPIGNDRSAVSASQRAGKHGLARVEQFVVWHSRPGAPVAPLRPRRHDAAVPAGIARQLHQIAYTWLRGPHPAVPASRQCFDAQPLDWVSGCVHQSVRGDAWNAPLAVIGHGLDDDMVGQAGNESAPIGRGLRAGLLHLDHLRSGIRIASDDELTRAARRPLPFAIPAMLQAGPDRSHEPRFGDHRSRVGDRPWGGAGLA